MEFENIYLLPIMIAIILIFVNIVFSQRLKFDKQFGNELSNRLYALSFVKPFSWFSSDDADNVKVKKEEDEIKKAGLDHLLNHRVVNTFVTILLISLLVVYSIILMFIDEISAFLDWVFKIENSTPSVPMETRILIGVVLLMTVLIPKVYIRNRAKKNSYYFTQELPVLQLSIILMLRAKRTMDEIMHTLSHNDTRYKKIFQKAHRIYKRSKSDCWDYLRREFEGTGFEDTIDTLSTIDQYSRQDTVQVLENGMTFLVEKSTEQKESGAALGNLFSQFSMALPFGGLVLLGAVPFVIYIFEMITNQSIF